MMGDLNYQTPVNASDPSEHEIEETPIVLQNRKDWLESLAQQGFSPRSQQSDEYSGDFDQKFDLLSKDAIDPSSMQREKFAIHSYKTTSGKGTESVLANRKAPINDTIDGIKERGDAYMMPSRIKELRSGNTSPRSYSASQGSQAEFHYQAVEKLNQVVRNSNEDRMAFTSINSGGIEIPRLSIDDSPRMTQILTNGVSSNADDIDGKEEYQTSHESSGVKDRIKKFQKKDSQTTDYFTPRIPRNPDTKSSVARPKSFHAGQGGSGDYRYTGNDYESTEITPLNKKSALGKPDMRIKLVKDPSLERATTYSSNNNNNKKSSAVGTNNSSSDIEYKRCVKDTRILQEIEDQETREREVKQRRNDGETGQRANMSGGLHQFLVENELR